MDKGIKVCVTGGSGYIASYLINNLLQRGYTVHATLRTLSDEKKVGLLKGLPHADTRLKLFEADIYKSEEFEAAIQGCSFVFHLATPFQHHEGNSQYKNTVEASVGGVRTIVESCIRSKTVKKIIYTATVTAAAPLKEDGSGFRDVIDENYWTPLNLPSASGSILYEYLKSKTLAEKEVLSYNGKGIEVVTLPLSMVAGDTVQSSMSGSMSVLICQAVKDEYGYKALKELQDMTVKIPVVHVQDVVDAHIFSMEHPHMNGRFLVATAFLKSAELAALLQKYLPDITIPPEFIEDKDIDVKWGSTKLQDSGFQYKFDADKIVQDTIACAKRFGKI